MMPKVQWWGLHDPRWYTVWQSAEFRTLLEGHNWFTTHALPCIMARPMGWFDPPSNSRFYFSAWLMNAIMRRKYDNPLVHDLYVLHEALHACTIDAHVQLANDPFVGLRVNEIEVSLETECWVYLREPSWVGKTFDPLWITQPHVAQMMNQPKEDLDTPCAMEPKEHAYRLCATQTPWIIPRLSVRGPEEIIFTEPQVWHARRHCSYYPHTPADQQVKKYEDMSERWLTSVVPFVAEIQHARSYAQQNNIDAYMQELERHVDGDLPWGRLLPQRLLLK